MQKDDFCDPLMVNNSHPKSKFLFPLSPTIAALMERSDDPIDKFAEQNDTMPPGNRLCHRFSSKNLQNVRNTDAHGSLETHIDSLISI